MHQSLSLAPLIAQFAIPALVYFGIAMAMRHTIAAEDIKSLLPNYMLMAGPHIVVGIAASAIKKLRSNLASNLAVANVTLVIFAAWLVSSVPPRESGLAWILYLPLASLALALAWLVRWYWAKRQNTTAEAQ